MSFGIIKREIYLILILLMIYSKLCSSKSSNLALRKPAYMGNKWNNYPPSNGVDGNYNDYNNFANGGPPLYFVVDLQDWFHVTSVNLFTKKNSKGERTSNFIVGLHSSFDPKDQFVHNKRCGQYNGKTETNKNYTLKCKDPSTLSRFVSIFQENEAYDELGFAELEVYGTPPNPTKYRYLGCYDDLKGDPKGSLSTEECLSNCKGSNFAAFKNSQNPECLCFQEVTWSVPNSFCSSSNNYYSLYNVSLCLNEKKDPPVPCHWRDCNLNNGLCGDHRCVTNKIGGVDVSECDCGKNYQKMFSWSDCQDINECEGSHTCQNFTTCKNTPGSYTCVCIDSEKILSPENQDPQLCSSPGPNITEKEIEGGKRNTGSIIGGVVGAFLIFFLLLALFLIFYFCVYKKNGLKFPRISSINKRNSIEPPQTNLTSSQRSTSINLEKLEEFMETNQKTICSQFKSLESFEPKESKVGRLEENKKRNRFKDIIPYDFNRVKLKGKTNDYINASHIMSCEPTVYKFISSQGVKNENYSEDFWQMVFLNKVSIIVMLTKPVEGEKNKCWQYWPDSGTEKYGMLKVEFESIKRWPTYELRTLKISQEFTAPFRLFHLLYLKWADHGVPTNIGSLFNFYKSFKGLISSQNKPVNTLVHCSAGIGRTGTFLCLDFLINEAQREGKIDPFSCLRNLRKQRAKMVQTENQYYFLHKAMVFFYKTKGFTNFDPVSPCLNNLMSPEDRFQKETQNQFESLFTLNDRRSNQVSCAPSFTRNEVFELHHLSKSLTLEFLFDEVVKETTFVLVADITIWDSVRSLIPSEASPSISCDGFDLLFSEPENKEFMFKKEKYMWTNEKGDLVQVVKKNKVRGNESYQNVTFLLLKKKSEFSCFSIIKPLLLNQESPTVLLMFKGNNYIELLSRITLLEMLDSINEIDVYQTVYNLINHNVNQPEKNKIPTSNLITLQEYRELYKFICYDVGIGLNLYEKINENQTNHKYEIISDSENKTNVEYVHYDDLTEKNRAIYYNT